MPIEEVPSQKLLTLRPNLTVGLGLIWSDLVGFGLILSDLVFGNLVGLCRIWSDSVRFGLIRSDLSDLVGLGQIQLDSVGFVRSSPWEGTSIGSIVS